jgi:hypothetical protein
MLIARRPCWEFLGVGLSGAEPGRPAGRCGGRSGATPAPSPRLQALLGTDERVPTQIFNGDGKFVADLQTERKNEKLFM